jgi:hypothetical protein
MNRRSAFRLAACTLAAAALFATGCGRKDEPPPRTLSQRQRDSLIGVSGLPGSGAVTRALAMQDSAAARAAREAAAPAAP